MCVFGWASRAVCFPWNKFASVVSFLRRLFRASSIKAHSWWGLGGKCVCISAHHSCQFHSAQGLSYCAHIEISEAVTLNATTSICCANHVWSVRMCCACCFLDQLLFFDCLSFLPPQWSMMQSCRKRKTNKASPTFLMCACVYGLVDTFCVSPFSLGVYGNSCFFSHIAPYC